MFMKTVTPFSDLFPRQVPHSFFYFQELLIVIFADFTLVCFLLCSRSLFRSGDERGALECYQRASAQYKLAGQLTVQFKYNADFLKTLAGQYLVAKGANTS
jgi:hypothetical protein